MDDRWWDAVAKSSMIVTMANGKHIRQGWRRAMYVIMRLQEMVELPTRVYIPDTTNMDDIKMHILMYTVIDQVNTEARRHKCRVYHHDGIVYCGHHEVIDHIALLSNQTKEE